MKSFLAVCALFLGASAQILGLLDLDVPPHQPDILGAVLSGNALTPEYNGPREVYIFNPAELTSTKGKRSGYRIIDNPSTNTAGALYTMGNGDGFNVIVSYAVFPNGTVNKSAHWTFPRNSTGGDVAGARFNSNSNITETALDSQGSLIQAGSRVFTVNAGDNSFSTFAVNCTNPQQLIPIGATVPVNGEYPNTIAVAIENHIVCVGTTGATAGIECYNFNAGFGPGGPNPPQYFTGTKVTLPLPIEQLPGLPDGPADTLSQLLFTDDERYLIAVVKSALNSDGSIDVTGYINVYPITSNGLQNPVRSVIQGSALLFGCVFNYNTYNLLCTDPTVGAFNLTMSASTLKFSINQIVTNAEIASGSMNCWSARSPYSNGPNYIAAINENYIAALDKQSGHVANVYYNGASAVPQLTEMATANNFVYALSIGNSSHGPTINVAQDVNLDGDLQFIQSFPVPQLVDSYNSYEGMQVFVPGDETNICDFT